MPLVEDDSEINPSIPAALQSYITHAVTDTHENYTRFFNALLIPQPSHRAFFKDLRSFRQQPIIISVLQQCDPNEPSITAETRKVNYRKVTSAFISSRFAHPWCRKAMSGLGNKREVGSGWWGAEWGATGRKMSQEAKSQEDGLHKLLVPIWVVMRGKMFACDDVAVENWYEGWLKEKEAVKAKVKAKEVDAVPPHKELKFAKSHSDMRVKRSGRTPEEVWAAEDEEEEAMELGNSHVEGASVATGVFRLAAAGMLVSQMSTREKWKMKRMFKKQMKG